jgi:RNase adaptor protein for sRNA GlmZ degradation
MELIVIHGAPGTGKVTVAQELARRTGYKVLHNHLTADLVTSLFPFGSEQMQPLSDRFRLMMLEEAARVELPGVIFTIVYAAGDDDAFMQQVIDAVEPHGGRVWFVLLTCDRNVLLERVASESRTRYRKLRDPGFVARMLDEQDLVSPVPHRLSLTIDNTNVGPEDTAVRIIDHLRAEGAAVVDVTYPDRD